MQLKKISLKNIRSYEHQEITFPQGSTLLSGDIGSGKTSVLLGIEFALFGLQPGQRGHALLKNGKDEGGVEIEFEVDEKEIIVERTLKRGKTVTQNYCTISVDGNKRELSVSELKDSVLKLLNYPKEFSKKQNVLYKFTVYTPQEEMKQIILQDPQTRINTLRHVFGIDKYKRILENVSTVVSKIREEKRIKEGMTSNLETDKTKLFLKEEELQKKRSNLFGVEDDLKMKTKKKENVQIERDSVLKKIEEKNNLQQEVEKLNIILSNKKESAQINNKLIHELKEQLEKLSSISFDETSLQQLENEISLNKKEREELKEKLLHFSSQVNSFNLKNEENFQLEQNMSNLESCPTCLQNVDAVYRANVLNKLRSEISENNKKIQELEISKKIIFEKLPEMELQIIQKETQMQELNVIKLRLNEIEEKRFKITELEKISFSLGKDVELIDVQMDNLKNLIFELKKFDNLFETKQNELKEALNQEKMVEIKLAELKKEIEFSLFSIDELKERIKETETIKDKLAYLGELENWLVQKFMPVISQVEKNVMVKLKADFSKLFEEWFNTLVADSFNVSLDDNFTPIVEQQDYEIEYAYLSGGERTAIALAYRLALNQVINSLMSKIKTKDIVILDEPTDGFSEQQLDKMRDVLQQLNIKQLIIVSHEQKIESFVENVIKFKKENGISKIE